MSACSGLPKGSRTMASELEAMRTAELMSPSTFRARLAALRELSNEADELGDYTS